MNKKRLLLLVLSILLFGSIVYANNALAERYLEKANEEFSRDNYIESYNYINSALQLYDVESIADNVLLFAEDIYYGYLKDVQSRKAFDEFVEIKNNLALYPLLASNRVTVLVKNINDLEVQSLAIQSQKYSNSNESEIYEQQIEDLRIAQANELDLIQQSQEKMFEHLDAQTEKFTEAITESVKQTDKFAEVMTETVKQSESTNNTVIIAILTISGLLVFICIIIIILNISNNKRAKIQQEQFEATLTMVAQMNRMPSERLAIGGVTDLYGNSLRYVGNSGWSKDSLPEPEQSEEEKSELAEIALICEQIGNDISIATGRKNNSKNVAELVYKLSLAMGISNATSMIYFCAAMVYDIGFLDINADLLQVANLSEEDKYEVRSHVQKGFERLDFVPERYKSVFIEATTLHHENLDGSGYPGGLQGDEIPLVARIIRIAETFVALISKRNYKGIMDKESALEELKNQGGQLDQSIVEILDSVV